ncbi:hypothetical protein Bca4012_054217 [Brassica carinata]
MGISKNILIAFVFTIFFIVSNVHCYPDFEVKQDYKKCYDVPCKPNDGTCEKYCAAISIQLVGECDSGKCCCRSKRPN